MTDEAPNPATAEPPLALPPASDPKPDPQREAASPLVYCARCGAVMNSADRFCHACGWEIGTEARRAPTPVVNASDRNRLTALLLCVFLGWVGAHRFYVGKTGTGLIFLFTLGFMGIGVIYDLIFIATGEFRDDRDRRVVRWD